ncbi:MAG: nuclear transport factor 2 family protein [Bacteroidales bacterium]|nr:nuclear transport factor 2 family protein [Bacteroidales bacterium]
MNTLRQSTKGFTLNSFFVTWIVTGIVVAAVVCTSCQPAEKAGEADSYAEDRALIEDLQARYMFALDFGDLDSYVATFTEDGILDIGEGEWRGRDSIKHILASIPRRNDTTATPETPELHPATGRHAIVNIVLKIEGDTAYGRAYWFHMSNDNPQRKANLTSYGHYEDVIVKVNGKWLFSRRKIFNEQVAKWAATAENPCW